MNKQMNKAQQGFTLIELMIVVAIIGILAAIALPAFSSYQASSKATAGLGEISAGKTAFELKANNGEDIAAAADIALAGSTQHCTISATYTNTAGTGSIKCDLLNAPSQVSGKFVQLNRADTGVWTCTTDIPEAYRPKGCTTGS